MEEVGVILLSSSEDEKDEVKKKKRKYEEEYKVVSDLTGFDNLRTMIEAEAEAFNRRSRKNKKKKGRNINNQPETKMVGKAEKIIMVKMRQEIEKPIIFITSSEDEDEDEDANNVKKKKYEEDYRVLSDMTSFDNLRAMIEAEAFRRRKKKRKRNKKHKYINIIDALSDMQQSSDVQAVETTGELDAEAVEETYMAEIAEKVISVMVDPEIEKPVMLKASSKDEDTNNMKKKKYEDEYRVISDLTSFDNLRAMYEAEALMRKRRESLKTKKENIVSCAEEVSVDAPKEVEQSDKVQAVPTAEELEIKSVEVDAPKEVEQSDKVQAVPTAEELEIKSVEVDVTKEVWQADMVKVVETTKTWETELFQVEMVKEEKQSVTSEGLESSLLLEKESVEKNYKVVPRNLLWRARYFDPSYGEEFHTRGNCKGERQKRPCFICAGYGHSWKYCKKGQDCFVYKVRGPSAIDCPVRHQDPSSNICLRCGGKGHNMFSCWSEYSPDDLKEIQCYVCKNFGHLCCVDFLDLSPRHVSCYSCGQTGHLGPECTKSSGENSGSKSLTLCYRCGEGGHIARKCMNHVKQLVQEVICNTNSEVSMGRKKYHGL
ncbi:cingulin-like isoform X3 [Quercus lobata]|uniref:cingulin-like isoform X3 n=1 Tax=Quercus lobata TaxID=97700 RepID=UPI001246C919|nr:cingulin-like isoform X3 [Quercus lobata]